ncbi:MAG: hypothetical protein WCS28_08440 [Thiomicrospira sp.]
MRYLLALCLLFPLTLHAATTEKIAVQFFNTLQKGQISAAYEQLLAGSVILRDQPQALTLLVNQTQNEFALNGKMIGYELIDHDDFGQSVDRLRYIVMQENIPTLWELYFYKPKADWFITHISFSPQLDKLQ